MESGDNWLENRVWKREVSEAAITESKV